MSEGKVSAEDKIYAVNLYLDGRKSQRQIVVAYGVKPSSVNQWIRNCQSMGADAFTLKGNKKYPKELKHKNEIFNSGLHILPATTKIFM